jgi:hypothetical protein
MEQLAETGKVLGVKLPVRTNRDLAKAFVRDVTEWTTASGTELVRESNMPKIFREHSA